LEEKWIERLTEVEQRTKSNAHRIEELEGNQKILYEMNTNIKLLAQQGVQHTQKIECIEQDVKVLKDKPARRWDLVITCIITAVISVAITYLFKI